MNATATSLTLDGFPTLLTRAWTWGKRALWIAAGGGTVVVVLEAIHLHGLLAEIHPWVAHSVTLTIAVVLLVWGGRAAGRYLRAPRVLSPPELPDPAQGWSACERAAYRDFAVRYLERQRRNVHLPDETRDRIPEAVRAIRQAERAAAGSDAAAAARALAEAGDRELGRILAPLDERANRLIRRAAVEVATATAVSPSILLDSLITLTRNLDLIARLADLYYGRPGLAGTLRVARDVIGSAVAAGALEVVSDHASGALAEMTGSWSSRLIGPLGQGMINGVVTMRFGAGAKYRCRSITRRRVPWRPWNVRQYGRAISTLTGWISDEVGPSVLGPLSRFARWTGKTTGSTVRGGVDLLRRAKESLGGRRRDEAEAAPEEESRESLTDDPLMDPDLVG